ncbi:MAG: 50S ribosome-binding GTPase [Armatimonadetes bacterium]|nr:50S ribosome-binding GTPase [Armatimonadota bacterium]
MATIFSELGTAKAECNRIAGDVQHFLQANGRRPPSAGVEPIRLALFGQYNSGKSTIVNALLGERAAVTGDAPETKIAQVYSVMGFEIADLPGGDARLQESEEALGALKSAHAVLYVVSSATGLDYGTMWEDLKLLVARGIPYLVVVNDKKPHQDEASEREFRQQLGEHFRELATTKLAGQDWTNRFFWVRAKSAERGRLEAKESLVLGSGIVPLEHALTSILRESDATVRAAAYLRALQDELRSLTNSLESASEAVELKGVEDALQRCDMARSRLDAVANLVVEDSFGPLKDSISAVLCRAMSGKAGKDAVATEVTDLVRGTYQGAFASFRRRCETEMADLAARAEREIKNLSQENRSDPKVQLGDIPAFEEGTMDPAAMLRRFAAGATALREAITGAEQAMAAAAAKTAAVEGGKAVASQGAKAAGTAVAGQAAKVAAQEGAQAAAAGGSTAIAEAGGQAVATAGKEGAKNAGKIIGPVVLIAIAAWEIWDGFRSASRERRAQEMAAREAEAKAELASRTSRQQFLAEASALVAHALGPVEKGLRDELKARSRSANDVAAKIAIARDFSSRLATVTLSLAGGMRA